MIWFKIFYFKTIISQNYWYIVDGLVYIKNISLFPSTLSFTSSFKGHDPHIPHVSLSPLQQSTSLELPSNLFNNKKEYFGNFNPSLEVAQETTYTVHFYTNTQREETSFHRQNLFHFLYIWVLDYTGNDV